MELSAGRLGAAGRLDRASGRSGDRCDNGNRDHGNRGGGLEKTVLSLGRSGKGGEEDGNELVHVECLEIAFRLN